MNLFEETTKRNQNLISKVEQKKMQETCVAFFGLSVGSHAALTWMMQSRALKIIIADPDTIDFSNLNRLRLGVDKVGKDKVKIISDQLKEINPQAKIFGYKKTTEKDILQIFKQHPKIDFIVEEVDNIKIKILLRKIAAKKNIALLNATDVGNNVFIDVERYDLKPRPYPFLGRIKNIENIDFSTLNKKQLMSIVVKIVGLENNSLRMINSLLSIGKTIQTWPQLGATATISGGAITTALTKIICREYIGSGRYVLSIDSIFKTADNKLKLIEAKRKVEELLNF